MALHSRCHRSKGAVTLNEQRSALAVTPPFRGSPTYRLKAVVVEYSVLPMLAVSGGRLVAPSTPFGKRGWWHEEWVNGAGWERMEVPATDCPRISPAFLAEVRASMGDWWFEQEFMCQFSSTVDQVFDFEFVNAAITAEVEPLFPLGVPYV